MIHWGVPDDAVMYIQESGRAGRDVKLASAMLMKNARDLRFTSKEINDYCLNTDLCRKFILYSDFPRCQLRSQSCMCCDVCARTCKCGKCDSKLSSFFISQT